MVNVAMAGCGSITIYRHAPEYAADSRVTIKGFFDPVRDRAEVLVDKYGGVVYETYEEMLNDSTIDAVSICSANKFHAPMTNQALAAGKHVLCEKPMAVDVDEAISMIETAEKAGKYLMIGHNQRLNPTHMHAKELLKNSGIGKILAFRTVFAHCGPETWTSDKSKDIWFFDKSTARLGAMCDLGIHKADLIRWLIDDEIKYVQASLRSLDKKDSEGNLIELDDNGFCILESDGGIVGSVISSWTNYGTEENGTVLYCENGRMRIYDEPNYSIIIDWKDGKTDLIEAGAIQTNDNQIDSGVIKLFVDSLEEHKAPEIDGYEGLAALKIILACLESSTLEKRVEIVNTK